MMLNVINIMMDVTKIEWYNDVATGFAMVGQRYYSPEIDYYSQPWEYGADVFGGVQGYPYYTNDAASNYDKYHNEIMNKKRKILEWLRRLI